MYHFIVNPNARTGQGKKIWNKIEVLLREKNVDFQVYFTNYHNHGTEIAKEITTNHSPCHLIVLGGDGTVNEVVNGIHDLEQVVFGYIPAGSSNDFARGQGLPVNPEIALEMILAQKVVKKINIGRLHYDNQTTRFAVSSGMGFDASIGHAALTSRLKKMLNWLKLGKLTYVGIALKQLALFKPIKMIVTLDNGEQRIFEKVYFSAVMNLKYEGEVLCLPLMPKLMTEF